MLQTEQDTPRTERAIRRAFCEFCYARYAAPRPKFTSVFEHGQWWVIWNTPRKFEDDQMTFSVVDADGTGSYFGLDFEEV